MKGYTSSDVFVLSITGEGCQESGEIKVNNSGKCVCICILLLIARQRSGPCVWHPTTITQIVGRSARIVIIIGGCWKTRRESRHMAVTAGDSVTQTSLHNETPQRSEKAMIKCKHKEIMPPDRFDICLIFLSQNKNLIWIRVCCFHGMDVNIEKLACSKSQPSQIKCLLSFLPLTLKFSCTHVNFLLWFHYWTIMKQANIMRTSFDGQALISR